MAEAQKTPFEPGMIAQIAGGIRYAFTGKAPAWFGPHEPMLPVVPEQEKSGVQGRQFDFPVGFNTRIQPRSGENITFAQMRNLADSCDLLRLVIETRKDQLAKMKWRIKPKDKDALPDARCQKIEAFLHSPDRENDWNTWLRMLLEDLFVLDAPTLYVRKTQGGDLYAFEPVDGSTIKRVIDQRGRTPLPPDPAYQQILKGLPAVNYSRDELIYRPRNPRTHKIYGFSPVEQIILTVNIALRRQLNQLSYYTEGNTPNLIFGVPESWNVDQIKQFQHWWDELNAGESKHKARFVPSGAVPHDTKPAALKDEMEEWLARIVCYAFSVSPQPFVKENNRATAQTAQEAALSEGLAPLMAWIKGLIDTLLREHFHSHDLEFAWNDDDAIKPQDQANIDKIYVDAKVMHPDEVRFRIGLPPLTPEQKAELGAPSAAAAHAPAPTAPDKAAPDKASTPEKPAAPKADAPEPTDPEAARRAAAPNPQPHP